MFETVNKAAVSSRGRELAISVRFDSSIKDLSMFFSKKRTKKSTAEPRCWCSLVVMLTPRFEKNFFASST